MYNYRCDHCGESFVRNYKKYNKVGKNFCSKKCSGSFKKKTRDPFLLQCMQCRNTIEVDTKWKSLNRKFCSNECRYDYMRENPEIFVSKAFVAAGRSSANSTQSITKGLKTKYEKGILVDWKSNKEWKKYYRECDRLTRNLRAEMLQEWDGYDYYDKEYIKDNLNLHFSHKDYPTLDHVIPKSEGFVRGMTPKEITSKNNLVWTKRTNNSSKSNKTIKEWTTNE